MSSSQTTIAIQKETRRLLQEKGKKYQTYDMLLKELVVKPDVCPHCGEMLVEKESQLSDSGNGLPTGSAARHSKSILESDD